MRVTVSNHITVNQPSPALLAWCRENLRINNPEYAKKSRMGLWVGNTPRFLDLYEIHGDDLILPFGTLREILSFLVWSNVQEEIHVPIRVRYGGKEIPLYDYQEEAVSAAIDNIYGIIQSKAGSGKTQMGIAIIKRLGLRALWLTHTFDLLKQSKERAEQYIDKEMIGTITEGKVNIGRGVTFATVQTMCNLDLSQYRDSWDVIVVDECHRVAGTPTAVTMFSKVLGSLSAWHKYGLSATVHRSDGMIAATYALLGRVIHIVPDEAVADRVMKVGIRPVGTGIKIDRSCLNTDGTLNYTKLIAYLCDHPMRNRTIVGSIILSSPAPSLILSDRLEHLKRLMEMLPDVMRQEAVMISGKMTSKKGKAEREQAIEDMRVGRKKYLFATYALAKEGLDIPCLERLFLTTPKKDYAVVTQSIGRIARTCDGKKDPVCYDFVDDIGYLVKLYKSRCSVYRKNDCCFIGGETS